MAGNAMAVPLVEKLVRSALRCLTGFQLLAGFEQVSGTAMAAAPNEPDRAKTDCNTFEAFDVILTDKDCHRAHSGLRSLSGPIPDNVPL